MRKLPINRAELEDIAAAVLQAGSIFTFRASGTSMSPFIRDGDTVYLKQDPPYEVGDVVLAKGGGGITLHRIVTVHGRGVITKGDGAGRPDPGTVSMDGILGKAYKVSGQGLNFHLRPPFSRVLAHPFFVKHVLASRFLRPIGKQFFRLFIW